MLDSQNYDIVEPIQQYLTFLSTSKSPNTVESYGYDLKAWWEFLYNKHLDWQNVQLNDLEDFAYWLEVGDTKTVVTMQQFQALRSARSINRAITAVSTFYEYHVACKNVDSKLSGAFFYADWS